MKIADGLVVTIDFTLKDGAGKVVESSDGLGEACSEAWRGVSGTCTKAARVFKLRSLAMWRHQ